MTDKTIPVGFTSHLGASETITGLILLGKQNPNNFDSDKFSGEYSNIIRDTKNGKGLEDLTLRYGTTIIQSAIHAGKSVNGLGVDLDWVSILNKAHLAAVLSEQTLPKLERMIQSGDFDKAGDIGRQLMASLNSTQRVLSVTADTISEEYTPFMKSGSLAWDYHIGGIPTVGCVILGAKTYTGKTTVAIYMLEKFLQEYPDREALFVTLEDMAEGWLYRFKEVIGNRPTDFMRRIRVMEFAGSPESIIQEASRHPKVGLIMLDYVDYLASETDLSSYTHIYKTMSLGSKSLAVSNEFRSMPIFMLAQFGKGKYQGGVPTPDALLYTGEQYTYQLVFLYHPDGDFYADKGDNAYYLPPDKGYGYLVVWKVKNARPHGEDFPGAIKVPWTPKHGYQLDVQGDWMSLASETKRKVKSK
jgi:hypothetical protein